MTEETNKELTMTTKDKIKKAVENKLTILIDSKNKLYCRYSETVLQNIDYFFSNSKWDKDKKYWQLIQSKNDLKLGFSMSFRMSEFQKHLERSGFEFIS